MEVRIVPKVPASPQPKPQIIQTLFNARYNPAKGTVSKPVVTLKEVQTEIQAVNTTAGKELLSPRNPANFLKDIVRNETRNAVFPAAVVAAGWTARQRTGANECFEFIPLPPGQTTAFEVLAPPPGLAPHPMQSLSLVPAGRRYGRRDESWLTQVATDLGVVQTHIALNNTHGLLGVALVASHIKLGKGEADALYYAEDAAGSRFLLACEVKSQTEVLDQDQIERVAIAVQAAKGTKTAGASVIPIGVKVAYPPSVGGAKGLIWVREYATTFPPLTLVSEGLYELKPPVPGIG